jgi:hypothetical protein
VIPARQLAKKEHGGEDQEPEDSNGAID